MVPHDATLRPGQPRTHSSWLGCQRRHGRAQLLQRRRVVLERLCGPAGIRIHAHCTTRGCICSVLSSVGFMVWSAAQTHAFPTP